MLQNAPDCTIKIFWGGSMPPNAPSKRVAMPRVATPPPQIIVAPLGKSCIRPWTTNEKFIWESSLTDSWLCVVSYMSMHYKIFLGGKNWLKS